MGILGFDRENWKSSLIYISIALAVFIGLAYYIYSTYVAPNFNKDYVENRELIPESEKSARLILVYADWCPHSKKIMNVDPNDDESGGWKLIYDKWVSGDQDVRLINNYNISMSQISESDKKSLEKFEKEYDRTINGFPTIYLIKDNQVIEFDANPTEKGLLDFLNTVV